MEQHANLFVRRMQPVTAQQSAALRAIRWKTKSVLHVQPTIIALRVRPTIRHGMANDAVKPHARQMPTAVKSYSVIRTLPQEVTTIVPAQITTSSKDIMSVKSEAFILTTL